MNKFLRWAGILLGGLIVLILTAGVVLYLIGKKDLAQTYPNIAVDKVNLPASPEAVARGKHIATIWSCTKSDGDDLGGRVLTRDPLIERITKGEKECKPH